VPRNLFTEDIGWPDDASRRYVLSRLRPGRFAPCLKIDILCDGDDWKARLAIDPQFYSITIEGKLDFVNASPDEINQFRDRVQSTSPELPIPWPEAADEDGLSVTFVPQSLVMTYSDDLQDVLRILLEASDPFPLLKSDELRKSIVDTLGGPGRQIMGLNTGLKFQKAYDWLNTVEIGRRSGPVRLRIDQGRLEECKFEYPSAPDRTRPLWVIHFPETESGFSAEDLPYATARLCGIQIGDRYKSRPCTFFPDFYTVSDNSQRFFINWTYVWAERDLKAVFVLDIDDGHQLDLDDLKEIHFGCIYRHGSWPSFCRIRLHSIRICPSALQQFLSLPV